MYQRPTRLWWIEIARGILGLLFVVVLVTHFVQTIHSVLVVFGGYLILDSLGDSYRLARQPQHSRRRWIDYTLSGISALVGLACITLPNVTGLALLALLLIRFFVHSASELRAAWRHNGRLAGSEWLFGGLLLLAVIVGIVAPRLLVAAFFWIIALYLLSDSGMLLLRGVLLRFAPQRLLTHDPPPAPQQADLSPEWPLTTRRGMVFVRHAGANGLGHIGWAFEWQNGWFNTGAVENRAGRLVAPPALSDFWNWHTLDPVGAMQSQLFPYDEYKVFPVHVPAPKVAWRTVVWESRTPYAIIEHNCSDVVYDILRAYGVVALADPAEQIIPNDWYDMLPGPSFAISAFPTIPIHLHRLSQSPITMAPLVLTIPATIQASAPRWRARRAWAEGAAYFDKMISDIGSLVPHERQTPT